MRKVKMKKKINTITNLQKIRDPYSYFDNAALINSNLLTSKTTS